MLEAVANERHDGHFTIMKFKTNWRIAFRTPTDREEIEGMSVGETFDEAARAAIEAVRATLNVQEGPRRSRTALARAG
jgi:hypothetical protein